MGPVTHESLVGYHELRATLREQARFVIVAVLTNACKKLDRFDNSAIVVDMSARDGIVVVFEWTDSAKATLIHASETGMPSSLAILATDFVCSLCHLWVAERTEEGIETSSCIGARVLNVRPSFFDLGSSGMLRVAVGRCGVVAASRDGSRRTKQNQTAKCNETHYLLLVLCLLYLF